MEESKQLALLERIEKNTRRQARFSAVQCGLTLVGVAFCVGALVLVYRALPQLVEVLEQTKTVLNNLEQATAQLAQMDLVGMAENVEELVSSGQEAMQTLSNVDLETLNQAIEDLAAVVEPLRKIFKALG